MTDATLITAANTTSNSTTVRLFMSYPVGRLRRKVRQIEEVASFPDEVHPRRKHRWHELLHYGRPGTGFVECRCGAMGLSLRRSR